MYPHNTNKIMFILTNAETKTNGRKSSKKLQDVKKINFYLKHLNPNVYYYMLKEMGYDSLIQYETLAGEDDYTTIRFDENGMPYCDVVDREGSKTYEFGIHHFEYEFRQRLCEYMDIDQLSFEIEYSPYNWFSYTMLPKSYYVDTAHPNTPVKNKVTEPLTPINSTDVILEIPNAPEKKKHFVSATGETNSDAKNKLNFVFDKPSVESKQLFDWANKLRYEKQTVEKKLLSGWTAKLNHKTKNSYVLTHDNTVNEPPKSWKIDGVDRNIFYSPNYNGWIIGLRYEQFLIDNGVKFE